MGPRNPFVTNVAEVGESCVVIGFQVSAGAHADHVSVLLLLPLLVRLLLLDDGGTAGAVRAACDDLWGEGDGCWLQRAGAKVRADDAVLTVPAEQALHDDGGAAGWVLCAAAVVGVVGIMRRGVHGMVGSGCVVGGGGVGGCTFGYRGAARVGNVALVWGFVGDLMLRSWTCGCP